MRTLKITLALAAIVMLTVSGVQSEDVVTQEPTYKKTSTQYNLLAHDKSKMKVPSRG
jgi:hypothetical protein